MIPDLMNTHAGDTTIIRALSIFGVAVQALTHAAGAMEHIGETRCALALWSRAADLELQAVRHVDTVLRRRKRNP